MGFLDLVRGLWEGDRSFRVLMGLDMDLEEEEERKKWN